MKQVRRFSYVALAALLLSAQYPARSAPSLCDAQAEQTIFSCRLHSGKVASICGSKDLSAKDASLQYRFGLQGHPPELVVPKDSREGSKAFSFTSYGGAKWESRNARFEVGSYSYLVSSYSGVYDAPEASITVRREGASCRVLSCQGEFAENMHALDQLRLGEISREELRRKCRPNGG